MNAEDKMKFIDVCVEITKYGNVVKCTPADVDGIISAMDENLVNSFEKFLFKKADDPEFEDPDVWDEWYDNLSLDTIDEKDIQVYDLPTKPIKYTMGNEEALIRELHGYAQDYVKSCSFVNPKSDNISVAYDFKPNGIFISFVSHGDRKAANGKPYNASIRSQVDKEFTAMFEKVKAAIKKFNEAQGDELVNAGVAIYRNDDVEPGCHTARCIYLTESDLFYNASKPVEKNYIIKFFNIVDDSYEK